MKLIVMLSIRNLFRQKRRSLLLGIAVGFGMMILVLANSFSHGISDNLFNRVVVYMTGHLEVSIMEKSRFYNRNIRDKDRMIKTIRDNVKGIKEIVENVSIFTRCIGNGKNDNAALVGVEMNKEMEEYLKGCLVEGTVSDFVRKDIENPVLLYADKAKALNVKRMDVVKVRLLTLTGQQQSARFTVAGIMKTNNLFESMAIFVHLKDLKPLIGYRPWETGTLQVNFERLNDPRYITTQADALFTKLKPRTAFIHGSVSRGKIAKNATVLGFFNTDEAKKIMAQRLRIVQGALPLPKSKGNAMVTESLARSLRLKVGDPFTMKYRNKFEKKEIANTYTVAALFNADEFASKNVVLLQEESFYKTYLEDLPAPAAAPGKDFFVPNGKSGLSPVFSPEWKLLERSATGDEWLKKIHAMNKTRWKGPSLDVGTMYEKASDILKMESALKIISFIAVLILFFIILIGVVNTLRMTIHERTREIGTMRAIGMQMNDVRNCFMMETVFLSFFSCVAGTLAACVLMGVAKLITIDTRSFFSIFLVDKHLYFLPTFSSIFFNIFFILLITAATSYFPARRAARLSAAEALRHFE